MPAQPSSTPPEAKPVEPVAETEKPEPTTAKAPDNLIHEAAMDGDIEAVKKYLIDGVDVNAKDTSGSTSLDTAFIGRKEELFDLLRIYGGNSRFLKQ